MHQHDLEIYRLLVEGLVEHTVTIRDGEDRMVATGRVRMLCLESDAAVAGERVGVER